MKKYEESPHEFYLEMAQEIIADEVFDSYEDAEIIQFPDEDTEILYDSDGTKIIMMPFQVDDDVVYGMVMLFPTEDFVTGETMLSWKDVLLINDYSDVEKEAENLKNSLSDIKEM